MKNRNLNFANSPNSALANSLNQPGVNRHAPEPYQSHPFHSCSVPD